VLLKRTPPGSFGTSTAGLPPILMYKRLLQTRPNRPSSPSNRHISPKTGTTGLPVIGAPRKFKPNQNNPFSSETWLFLENPEGRITSVSRLSVQTQPVSLPFQNNAPRKGDFYGKPSTPGNRIQTARVGFNRADAISKPGKSHQPLRASWLWTSLQFDLER
jgi:hypothetical protein